MSTQDIADAYTNRANELRAIGLSAGWYNLSAIELAGLCLAHTCASESLSTESAIEFALSQTGRERGAFRKAAAVLEAA